jgi:hypothetical protein
MEDSIDKTLNDREKMYGSFEDNARITMELLNVITTSPTYSKLSCVHKEAVHMIFHKIARLCCGDAMNSDTAHDIAGYATLLERFIISKTCHDNTT